MIAFWRRDEEIPIEYKVDINPSYEWAPEAESLNVSHRELEVLALVVEGYKNKEIGKILKIEHQSVKNHLQHLLKKMNVKNNTQAYIIAIGLNMIRMRARVLPGSGLPAAEIQRDKVLEDLRRIVAGTNPEDGYSDKDRHRMRVFLKEHGIEPDNW
jgi:DNA-binding CsgD family transcriptional regulator